MKDIQLIALDIDGTLVSDEGLISLVTKKVLLQVQENGIRLVLASGRDIRNLSEIAHDLSMNKYGGFLIGANGALLVEYPSMNIIHHKTIKAFEVQKLFDFGLKHLIEVLAMKEETIVDAIPDSLLALKDKYREEHNINIDVPNTAGMNAFIKDQRSRYPNIFVSNHYIDSLGSVNKVCFAHEEKVLDEFSPILLNRFHNLYSISRTSKRWIEITAKNVTKGSALKSIKDRLNLDNHHMMAFGDGGNDLSMFKECRYKIAMKNAMQELKEQATHIADSNNDDGIAKFLMIDVLKD